MESLIPRVVGYDVDKVEQLSGGINSPTYRVSGADEERIVQFMRPTLNVVLDYLEASVGVPRSVGKILCRIDLSIRIEVVL